MKRNDVIHSCMKENIIPPEETFVGSSTFDTDVEEDGTAKTAAAVSVDGNEAHADAKLVAGE